MTSKQAFEFLSSKLSKQEIERGTLWLLAVAIFLAVFFSVAKYAVRDYRDLQREINKSVVSASSPPTKLNKLVLNSSCGGSACKNGARSVCCRASSP